ncbi:MAG: hypothetical protein KGL02_10565 [Acidobacteriota bacterium]|nr:hypothetical protein [Acidobacteriota bacterium]MDE3169039.1 hypothetical protein [Acidobacteriota bacterium]
MAAAANADALEVVPGAARQQIEGWIPDLARPEELRKALDTAFNYRGDVTITRKDGSKIEGYVFDRRTGATLENSVIRVMPKDTDEKLSIAYSEIAALAFSGRDTAAGKSWEAWVRQYWKKRAAGEKDIALHPESLE